MDETLDWEEEPLTNCLDRTGGDPDHIQGRYPGLRIVAI
jgi:hypothetical protein